MLLNYFGALYTKTPFKYFNFWARYDGFSTCVKNAWNITVEGAPLFKVASKLKNVKLALKQWGHSHIPLNTQIDLARQALKEIQVAIVHNSSDVDLQHNELQAHTHLASLLLMEESMLKQNFGDKSINLGGENSRYFYGLFKNHQKNSYIDQITDNEGNSFTKFDAIFEMFISHFKKILSPPLEPLESTLTHIDTFGHLSYEDVVELMKTITIEEIEYAIQMASPNILSNPL